MVLNNPSILDHVLDQAGDKLKVKTFDIPAWNMDADDAKDITHGLTQANIRVVDAYIWNDAQDVLTKFVGAEAVGSSVSNGKINILSTVIQLSRTDDGLFNAPTYDDTGFNRGFLIVFYIE